MKRNALRAALAILVLGALTWALAPWLQTNFSVPTKPAVAAQEPAWSAERLDEWLAESPAAKWLLLGGKGLLVLLGVLFLVQEILRAERVRHGLLPGPDAAGPTVVARPGEALGLGLLFPFGVMLLLPALWPAGPSRPVGDLEFGVGVTVLAFLPPALLTALRRLRLAGAERLNGSRAAWQGLRFACIATLIVLPLGIAWAASLKERGVSVAIQDTVQTFVRPVNPAQPWVMGVFGVFVAPFTEEAIFRGLLYPALRRSMPGGALGAALLVSLLFAAIHANLMAFLPLFVLALVLTWVMERTNSLRACVLVHAIHNASSVVPLLLRRLEGP